MDNWIPKNKIVKLALGIASLSMLLYLGGLLVVLGKTNEVKSLYNDTESEFFKEKKFWAVKSIADANKETIQSLRDFFIQKNDEVKFIEQVENVARNSGIDFEMASIDVKTDKEDSFKENVAVKIKVEGPWRSVAYFVEKLERMPFGVSVEEINLDADASGRWSGSVGFVVFREK